MKLARVVSVFEPSSYLYKTVKRRACKCEVKHQGTTITEVNSNMLKIFKNQVNYSTKLGKSLYYEVCEENKDTFCDICQTKFTVVDQKYAPCQKAEILALSTNQHRTEGSAKAKPI